MTKLAKWILCCTLLFLWSCGSPEQAAVDQFFRAAQANDRPTLAYMSAVGSPLEVDSWKVVEVSSRSTEPYTLPDLLEKFQAVEKERNAALEERTKYGKDHKDDLEKIIPKLRDNPDYKFKGKLGEVQEEWDKLLEDRKEKERTYQEMKQEVNRQTSLASKSVMRQLSVGELKGDIAVTKMLLNLTPKDSTAELPFAVTLRKYELSEEGSDRVEPARWVIVDFEGTTPEAVAAAEAAAHASSPTAVAEASEDKSSDDHGGSGSREPAYEPQELRGQAKVQILSPVTKVEGNEVVSKIKVRNISRDWIVGFQVTEHWYDKQGNAVGVGSETHRQRFMPGEVLEIEVRTQKGPNFFQNQFEFTHANGDVNASVVASFPT